MRILTTPTNPKGNPHYLTLPYLTLPYLTLPLPYLTLPLHRVLHVSPNNNPQTEHCLSAIKRRRESSSVPHCICISTVRSDPRGTAALHPAQPSVLHIRANDVAVPVPYHCTTVPLDDIFVPSEMI
jgi:hypothetical protein